MKFEDKEIIVCASCKKATCIMGIFYCENYKGADIEKIKIKELRKIQEVMYGEGNTENESWWKKQLLNQDKKRMNLLNRMWNEYFHDRKTHDRENS